VLLVEKKDGTKRFCVDYRRLNAITRKDAYPLPLIDEIIDFAAGRRFRSTLDLLSGYWQIPLYEGDKEKTAFATRSGIYEFNVMPFGLCNAPATFQRHMDAVLQGPTSQSGRPYIDDVGIFSHSFSDHLRHLQSTFNRIRETGMVIKLSKCHFLRRELPYLGYVIRDDGIIPDPTNIKGSSFSSSSDILEGIETIPWFDWTLSTICPPLCPYQRTTHPFDKPKRQV
jgi:hypothetical protein